MDATIREAVKIRNTQAKSITIILGCQRLRRATYEDALAIAHNGAGYVRQGKALTWFWSEGFAQGLLS